MIEKADVVIIGAGPSGSVAAKMLHDKGYHVIVVERQKFPRFSIGESLLPHCMEYLQAAGLVDAVNNYGFQFKDGASFHRGDELAIVDFNNKFSQGPGTTFQVQRADFDNLLAQETIKAGVDIRFEETILSVDFSGELARLSSEDKDGNKKEYEAKFVLDASGYGRVLSRLLDLESPSNFPMREGLFSHIEDNISAPDYDRDKISIIVHPEHHSVWYWLIPFSNGRSSLGIVAEASFFEQFEGDYEQVYREILQQEPRLRYLLPNAKFDTPVRKLSGYSANVKHLTDKNYALLGNAGEFLDPVFSSGVTIAFRSAWLAANLLDRQFKGETVDWQKEFAYELQRGVDVFRTYVEGWYDGRFQDIIFAENKTQNIEEMIIAILAGYAWDEENPYVSRSEPRMNALAELCRSKD